MSKPKWYTEWGTFVVSYVVASIVIHVTTDLTDLWDIIARAILGTALWIGMDRVIDHYRARNAARTKEAGK